MKQFPYQVSLRTIKHRHFCGGSILAERWVITACHCTIGQKAENLLVAVGTIKMAEGENYYIERIINHEAYNSDNIRNDISLLKTKTEIQFSDLVRPVAIRMSRVSSREEAVASGWGLTSFPGDVPENLQFIATKTITNEECKARHPLQTASMIYAGNVCTFTKGKEGMCMGDSGGPLVVNGELVGLVSWGIPCGAGYPDVFTRVSEFSGWVTDKMVRF